MDKKFFLTAKIQIMLDINYSYACKERFKLFTSIIEDDSSSDYQDDIDISDHKIENALQRYTKSYKCKCCCTI